MDKNVPEIRFKGFTTKWEQKKLGEIANIIDPHPSHRAPEETKEGVPFIGIGDVDVDGTINYHNVRIVDEKEYEEHHRRYDLAIPSLGIGRVASLGKVIRLRNDIGKYTVSPTLSIMQFNTSSDLDFLFSAMSSPLFQKQFTSLSNGSTRQSVGIQDLRAIEISISSDEDEQKEIGSFFKYIDNLISLETRELDTLKTFKKSCLEKMFPKEGETVPEIRFKGFEGPWNVRKVKDICSISTGKSNTQDKIADGMYPFYVRSPIVERSNRYLFDEEAVLTVGDGYVGKVFHYVNGKYDLHQRVYRMFDFSQEVLAKYFYYFFSVHFYNRVMSMTAKTSVDSVRYEMIADMEIAFPTNEEQKLIFCFFDNVDNIITFTQQKLDKLKNLKKALLDKMFV